MNHSCHHRAGCGPANKKSIASMICNSELQYLKTKSHRTQRNVQMRNPRDVVSGVADVQICHDLDLNLLMGF
jgi:hypothetical protein